MINEALEQGNDVLACLEAEALESGIKKIADFKVSKRLYEESMYRKNFELIHSLRQSPKLPFDVGGVYFYVWKNGD